MTRALVPVSVGSRIGAEIAKSDKSEVAKEVGLDLLNALPPVFDREHWVRDGIGAAAGFALFRRTHPIAGAILGAAAVRTVPDLVGGNSSERVDAAIDLTAHGLAGVGVLLWERHPLAGWLLGYLTGFGISAAFPNTAARARLAAALDKMRSGAP